MKNFPPTWDGRKITSSLTGWSEYSTSDEATATRPPVALSIQDVLNQIRTLRHTLSSPRIEKALSDLNKHIADTNNPHHTNLDQFTQQVADILYREYLDQGGTGSLDFYLQSLFYTLRVATIEEMETAEDVNLLISVKGANMILTKHENDTEAHKALFEQWFPGNPVTADPVLSVAGTFGMPPAMIYILNQEETSLDTIGTRTTDTPALAEAQSVAKTLNVDDIYSVIDHTGILKFLPLNRGIIPDWGMGQPLFTCFGEHTNLIPESNIITENHLIRENVGYRVIDTVSAPDGSTRVTEVYTTNDVIPVEHNLVRKDFELTIGSTKSISLFVRPGTCHYFAFRFEDMVVTGVEAQAIYNLDTCTCTMMYDLGRYTGSIQRLSNGWCRCCFTMHHPIGQKAKLIGTFFQFNTDNVLESFKYQATTGICGWVWGLQIEDSVAATPYIANSTDIVPARGYYYQLDIENKWDVNNMTLCLQFTNPKYWGDSKIERPVFTIVDKEFNPIWYCRMINTGEIILERYSYKTVDTVEVAVIDFYDRIAASPETWCQFALTVDNTSIASMMNLLPGLGLTGTEPTKDGYRLLIGCDHRAHTFDGYFREITLYDRAVTTEELKFLTGEIIHE